MDPLTLVREYNMSGKTWQVEGDNVLFGKQYMFPKRSFTAFRSAKDFCTLEVVLWVLQTKAMSQPEYLKATALANLTTLAIPDRRKLLEYLEGRTQLRLEAGAALPLPVAPLGGTQPAAKRARLEEGGDALDGKSHYRQLRDRNTMLLAPSKDFKHVLDIANKALTQLSGALKQRQKDIDKVAQSAVRAKETGSAPAAKVSRPAAATTAPAAVAGRPTSRFNRDNTAEQLRAMGGEAAANIGSILDMYGPSGSAAAAAPPAAAAATGKAPPSSTAIDAPPSKGTAAAGVKPGSKDSSQHTHRSSQHPQHAHKVHGAQPQHHKPGSSKPGAGPPGSKEGAAADKLRGAVPLIIVPSGLTAMVNMYNARQFLEAGRYESVAAAQASGRPKQVSETFKRTIGKPPGKTAVYEVTDKPPSKTSSDWGRVVAVIVQGVKWQFKDYPYKGAAEGDLMEMFSKVTGFYIHFADDKVPELVANANIKRLGLAREKRHMDMTVMLDFYRYLDQFLTTCKSQLAY